MERTQQGTQDKDGPAEGTTDADIGEVQEGLMAFDLRFGVGLLSGRCRLDTQDRWVGALAGAAADAACRGPLM